MSKKIVNPQESLQGLAEGDLTILNVLQRMIEGTFEESGLQAFELAQELAEDNK